MHPLARKALFVLVSGIAASLAACGGGSGGNGGGGGGSTTTTPTVTVTPSANSITTADSLRVAVTVSGSSGAPTGSVTLSRGSYTSTTALSAGSAAVTIAAGSLAAGTDSLKASYTPDSASSSKYNGASGTAAVSVTVASPAVTVTPASSSIGTGQPLDVTVSVAGTSSQPTPTGSVTLTNGGNYTAGAQTLASGSVKITIPAGSLAAGTVKLTASYSPDSASTSLYASASGSANVTVILEVTPTVTVSPASQSLTTDKSLSVTVKVNPTTGNPAPTGSIVLTAGTYASSATVLAGGSATVAVPGYSLSYGSATLSAAYTPDSQSSSTYTSSNGSATVSVARTTPTLAVTPGSTSIDTSQTLHVTVTVAGPGTGAPAASGSVKLTSGTYASAATTLAGGSASITIPAGQLASGSDTLTAAYTADTAGSSYFNSASGTSPAITVITFSTVIVNQSTTLAPVTDQLLGMNLANWYDVVGNAGSINPAFAQAGIKAIRWPGGSWSDQWHWRTSTTNLLPYLCNDPGPGTGWGGYSSFSDFVTSIAKGGNYDLALTANYGSNATCNGGGDPTEAAGWVAEAVSEGYAPSHVTVGNENYGNWEFDLHTIKNDPATYANSVIGSTGFYSSIKTASPTTKVGVVVDANCTAASGCTSGWDSTVLSTAKGSYDFVEYHFYPQYGTVTSDTYLVHQAAVDFRTNIYAIKSELAAAGENATPIYVGELGGNSSNPGTQSWSITQGLYAGQILGEAMNAGISRLTWWIGFGNCLGAGNNSPLLYGWQNTWGALSVFSDGTSDPTCPTAGPIGTLSPTAQAFNLFQNIAVTGESALSTTFGGDGNNIRVYAATHSGGTALLLFNLNQAQSQPVQIELSGGAVSSSDVQVITYDKKIYDYTDPACKTDPGCTYDPSHDYSNAAWATPRTTDMGAQNLPLTLTLTPWSMNVVLIK